MIRILKSLGPVLIAALAIGTMAASTAGAADGELHIDVEPAVITAQQNEPSKFTFVKAVVQCPTTTFEGQTTKKTTFDMTLTPAFEAASSWACPLKLK